MKHLKIEEYLPYAPTSVGKVRINHTSADCSGGRDSMIVSRNVDGSVNATCYRCGKWGKWSPEYNTVRQRLVKNGEDCATIKREKLHIPDDVCVDITQWPVDIQVWLGRAISDDEVREYGFVYSKKMKSLIMPIDKNNFQCRISNYTNNKYISYLIDNNIYKYKENKDKSGCLFIVEDYLSFIKIGRWFSVLCLFGTNMRDKALLDTIDKHDKVYVFLDNDNTIVKRKQTAMARRIRLFTPAVVIKADKDPKYMELSEIEELL